jgi:glucose-6-phosphate isomerase
MQTIAALGALRQSGLDPRNCVLGISEPTKAGKRNGLREMLEKHQLPLLQHDTGVGGRYSALTNVGLLPAAILGLDIGAIRNGAGNALLPVLDKYEPARVPAAVGAARSVALAESKGRWMSVLMAYSDRLQRFMQCTCSCGPRASARTARGQLRSQRSGRSTSTAKCNCSSPARATNCSTS